MIVRPATPEGVADAEAHTVDRHVVGHGAQDIERGAALSRWPDRRAGSGGEPQHGLGGQAEQGLATGRVVVPRALVPRVSRQVVARVQQLAERHAPERGDREERRGLHLDGEAAFGDPALDLPAGLPVEGVGGPCRARHVRHVMRFQGLDDRVDRLGRGATRSGSGAGSGRRCPRPARRTSAR